MSVSTAAAAAAAAARGLGPVKDRFSPREYQREVFRRATRENVIACLDTGSGKTYVAVLLVRQSPQKSSPRRYR